MSFPHAIALLEASLPPVRHPIYSFDNRFRAGETIGVMDRTAVHERLAKDGFLYKTHDGNHWYEAPSEIDAAYVDARGNSPSYPVHQEADILAIASRIWLWAWKRGLIHDPLHLPRMVETEPR